MIKGRKFTFYLRHSYTAQNFYNMHMLSLYLANNKNTFRGAAGWKKECRGPSEGSLTPKLTPLTPTPRGLLGPANQFHSASSPENGSHFPFLPGNNCDSVQGGMDSGLRRRNRAQPAEPHRAHPRPATGRRKQRPPHVEGRDLG